MTERGRGTGGEARPPPGAGDARAQQALSRNAASHTREHAKHLNMAMCITFGSNQRLYSICYFLSSHAVVPEATNEHGSIRKRSKNKSKNTHVQPKSLLGTRSNAKPRGTTFTMYVNARS